MTDHLIHGGTHGLGEPVVPQGGGVHPAGNRGRMHDPVQGLRGDPGRDMGHGQVDHLPCERTHGSYFRNHVGVRVDRDGASEIVLFKKTATVGVGGVVGGSDMGRDGALRGDTPGAKGTGEGEGEQAGVGHGA